jgi:hypothetical protein
MEDRWFEIWYDQGDDVLPSYLLVVAPDATNPSLVLVCDPFEKNKVVHQGDNYENTRLWLLEDEYSLVDGRIYPDDGWPLETRM